MIHRDSERRGAIESLGGGTRQCPAMIHSVTGSLLSVACALSAAASTTAESSALERHRMGPPAMLAIVERVCLHCHNAGGNVPFEFRTGAHLKRASQTAAEALRVRAMPPWLPTQDPSHFLGVPSITEVDRAALIQWFEGGAEGSEAWTAPPPPASPVGVTIRFGDGWRTSAEADLTYARTFLRQIGNDFPLRFRGFRYRLAETGALEMVMLNGDTTGMGRQLDARDGDVGSAFHADIGTVPAGALGAAGVCSSFQLPDGFTFAVEPDCDLLAEAHARALGRSASGAFSVMIEPSRPEDTRIVESFVVGGATTGGAAKRSGLVIEYLCDTLDAPMEILSVLPNTGIRCVTYDLNIIRRGGAVEGVINIPAHRAWADRAYVFRTPLKVEAGDRFSLRVSHADGYAFLHTHASAVLLIAPPIASPDVINTAVSPAAAAVALPPTRTDPVEMASVKGMFRIARDETSVAEWSKVMDRAIVAIDAHDTRDTQLDSEMVELPTPIDPTIPVDPLLPCVGVSYYDAVEYCNALSKQVGLPPHYRLSSVITRKDGSISSAVVASVGGPGYRLPTEAEWELAAASMGDAWCVKTGHSPPNAPRHAGAGTPNELGIVNLAGNVWEWCDDGYATQRKLDGNSLAANGPTNRGRVVKGGSFADSPAACVAAFRSGLPPSTRTTLLGFRIARD